MTTLPGAAARIYNWGGQDILHAAGGSASRCVVLISLREAWKKNFRLHFSAIRMGSRGTFVLLHCKFQMYEDCRSRGRHVLLSQISLTNVIRTYTGILDCGLVPKPFGCS